MHLPVSLRLCLVLGASFSLASSSGGDSPSWWSVGDPPVIDPTDASNNHGPANIGQAKQIAEPTLDAQPHETTQIAAELRPDAGEPVNEWSALMRDLERDIANELPSINSDAMSAYEEARGVEMEALAVLAKAEKNITRLGKAEGLVRHARHKWIGGAAKEIAKARKDLRNAKTSEERAAASSNLIKWQQNKQAGLDALRERQQALSEIKVKESDYRQQLEDARQALDHAQAGMAVAVHGLGLDSFLKNDSLDGRLARYIVLKHSGPERIAEFASENDDNRDLIERLMRDEELLVQMAVADGAKDGNYGRAMRILQDIRNASDRSHEGRLARVAIAVALEHASPVKQRNPESDTDAPPHVDPVKRYLHYEEAYLAGELDPGFKDLSVWEYRFVVNGQEPDDILKWGRAMLRNYRPDHIATSDDRWRYVQLVRSEIRWGTQDYGHDRDDLQFTQNILLNGGTCGRRAVMGRFVLRAFGVPTTERPQTGHASLVRWTANGWVPCLGGDWGGGWTMTPYGKDLNFLASCKARATGEPFMQVMRAHWVGEVSGEPRTWGLIDGKPGFWNGVALYIQRENNRNAYPGAPDDAAGDKTEADAPKNEYVVSEADRRVTIGGEGVITIPAASTSHPTQSNGKIIFMKSEIGGTQMHYSRDGLAQDFEYRFEAPSAGKYALVAKIATPSWRQRLRLTVNGGDETEIDLPHTLGMWETTKPVTIELIAGENLFRFTHASEGFPKGFSIKEFTLTPIK